MGNKINSNLPLSIDAFLMDIAQMHGTITYDDIANLKPDETKLQKFKYLRRKFNENGSFDFDDQYYVDIAKKVAVIVKL